jgi:transposase-like protein
MQKRQDLVRMVLHERKLIAMVARRLSLKLPTARLIINKFLKTGTFTVKKAERTAEAVQPESPEPENNAVSEERLEVEPVNQNHFGDVNQ